MQIDIISLGLSSLGDSYLVYAASCVSRSLWQDLQATKAAAHTRTNEHGKHARVQLVSHWRIRLFGSSIADDNSTVVAGIGRRR
jgi:hypothetical protein